jgi:hypothetical protein
MHLTSVELKKMIASIQTNTSSQRRYEDEVGKFERDNDGLEPIPKGSRVMIRGNCGR